jgi:signal transduction histidine kinase/ActR/RegA family two-component response regulator
MRTGEAWFSDAFRRRLGYPNDAFAHGIDDLRGALHPEDLPRFEQAAMTLATAGTPIDLDLRIRRHDGTWAPCRLRAEASAAGQQHALGALLDAGTRARVAGPADRARPARASRIAAALDDTSVTATEFAAAKRELERQNAELQRARAEAEASAIAKTAFLANMSHEIRTPMTAILGFSDMLGDPSLDPDERQALTIGIRRNGEHLLKIISDILDLSKIEAGGMSIEILRCDPRAIVEEALQLVAPRARQMGYPIRVEFAPDVPQTLRTDPTRLRQILINLLGNAVKFTQSGEITVHVDCPGLHESPAARRDPEPSDAPVALHRVRFRVRDTGIGMSDVQLARLFRPFTQGDASVLRRFGGTGLGLAISRRLARMLGGDIVAASMPGAGSTFTVEVATDALAAGYAPLATAAIPEAIEPKDDHAAAEARARTQGQQAERTATSPRPVRPTETSQIKRRSTSRAVPPGATPAPPTPAPAPSPSPCPLRVLLAEDGVDNQRLILYHLKRCGCDAMLVENGRDAVVAVEDRRGRGERFDVIILDMQMPHMDGYEAARRLRMGGCDSLIIALTADAMQGDRERCLAAGCDRYLPKPVDARQLAVLMAEAAGKRAIR